MPERLFQLADVFSSLSVIFTIRSFHFRF